MSSCVEARKREGSPGFWSRPFKSIRQIFRSNLSVAKARRFPSREMAGETALLASRLILLGMAALDAALRQSPGLDIVPELNTNSLPSGNHAAPKFVMLPV